MDSLRKNLMPLPGPQVALLMLMLNVPPLIATQSSPIETKANSNEEPVYYHDLQDYDINVE